MIDINKVEWISENRFLDSVVASHWDSFIYKNGYIEYNVVLRAMGVFDKDYDGADLVEVRDMEPCEIMEVHYYPYVNSDSEVDLSEDEDKEVESLIWKALESYSVDDFFWSY